MRMHSKALGVVALGLALAGCGSTVGDPCTVDRECGDGAICINRSYTPGGYCSQPCSPGNDETCPAGTTCVREGAGRDYSACFLRCEVPSDCREGYRCVGGFRDHPFPVCVAE